MTHQTFPKPKKAPKVPNRTTAQARAKRRRASEAVKRDVYALVDARDGGRCRGCGGRGEHHHHITFRSQGGTHTTENIVTLCSRCHAYVHARTMVVTGNANDSLIFAVFVHKESKCPS